MAWGASPAEVMRTGNGKSARMVTHYGAASRATKGAGAKHF